MTRFVHTTRPSRRQVLRAALGIALAAAWLVFLRPQHLGGPAAYVIVAGDSMLPALESGDLVVAMGQEAYGVGDVIVYAIPAGEPGAGSQVIHRIIGGDPAAGFITQGDNRDTADPWRPRPTDVVGTLELAVPTAGRVLAFARSPLGLGGLTGFGMFAFILFAGAPRRSASA